MKVSLPSGTRLNTLRSYAVSDALCAAQFGRRKSQWDDEQEAAGFSVVTCPARTAIQHGAARRGSLLHRVTGVCTAWTRWPGGEETTVGAKFDCGPVCADAVLGEPAEDRALCARCDFDDLNASGLNIYFAERSGLIKIGCSSSVLVRVAGLKARLLAIESGSFARERELHEQFAGDRRFGEWFSPSRPLAQYVASLKAAA